MCPEQKKGCKAVSQNERRRWIIEVLNRRRHETMSNLARECGVSRLTICRDIQDMSLEYPIYTTKGNGGGVFLEKWFILGQKYLSTYQQECLKRLLSKVDQQDRAVIESILADFARPSSEKTSC